MKLNNNQITSIIITLIVIIVFILSLTYGTTQDTTQDNNKDTIISLQEEKIRKLESELGKSEIDYENNSEDLNFSKSIGDVLLDGEKNIESISKDKDASTKSDTIKNYDNENVPKENGYAEDSRINNIENNDTTPEHDSKELSMLFKEAYDLSIKGEYDKAIEKYLEYLKLSDNGLNAYYNLTIAYGHKNELENSLAFATKFLYVASDSGNGYKHLGVIYSKMGDEKNRFICKLISNIIDGEDINTKFFSDEQKIIYDLEYEKLKKLIKDKKYSELRDYTFNKYLDITEDTFNLEDYIGIKQNGSNSTNIEDNTNSKDTHSEDAPDFVMLRALYNQAVDEATAGNTQESINLYKRYITLISQLTSGDYAIRLSSAWNNLAFSFKTQKNEGAEIVSFMMAKALGTRYDRTGDVNASQKQIMAAEQATINEYIANKDYEYLRRYLFHKYMGETDPEFDIENNG